MSRRSGRIALHIRDGNASEHNTNVLRKRKLQPSKKVTSSTVKKQSYEIQKRWSEDGASPCALIEMPHKELEPTGNLSGFKQFRFKNLFIKPSPLPYLSWASSDDVWIKMLNKDLKYVHDKDYLLQHPSVELKMRAILFDWLFEVCSVYCLQRQTAYLAQDFFDRFMVTQENVQKENLQLIGITALFIASKIEEIYPPKVYEFAYVTDGVCVYFDILDMELVILKALNWNLSPETAISWLKLYSQVEAVDAEKDGNFLIPSFSQDTYIQMAQLLDLCILDINSLDYSYGILAAAAFWHFYTYSDVRRVTGISWDIIAPCVRWMRPFMDTVEASPPAQLQTFDKVKSEERHNIQTHTSYLSMLKEVHRRQQEDIRDFPPGLSEFLTTAKAQKNQPINH